MKLDTFVNTKQKRHYIFVMFTLLMGLKLLFVYGRLASYLISITTYSDVFDLLEVSEISWTYLSRLVLVLMSKANPSVITILKSMLMSIRVEGVVIVACVILLLYNWRHRHPILLRCIVFSFGVMILICILFLIRGFNATSLMQVVECLQYIGFVILLTCITYGFLCVYGCIQTLYRYKDIYEIEVIEVEQ